MRFCFYGFRSTFCNRLADILGVVYPIYNLAAGKSFFVARQVETFKTTLKCGGK